ncbi:alpha/beta fold hydrolase [Chroococcidiopsis sp. FACHB-1243]|nr:alpha/beta fold hydrolase [Chroococcidiopsis sp. [FACHB-1243]]
MKMSEYSNNLLAIAREVQATESKLSLIAETTGSQFLIQPNSEKVCLFFHGFTAVSEQFAIISKAFYQAGYHVLIPLLPGHGIAGEWNGDNPPPLPEDPQIYQEFGRHWLEIARTGGKEIIIGGLSGGSTLAAWLALEYPDRINKTLIFAPYLSGSNKVVDLFVRIFNIYFEWWQDPQTASFGYDGFAMPALRVFLDMGTEVLEKAQTQKAAPMLIVSSESDRAVGNREHEKLFNTAVQLQPKSWYVCFDDVWDIPHNMMTQAEGNEHVDLLISLTLAYVNSDATWAEMVILCDRLKQDDFSTAIAQLNLHGRIASAMATIMEIIDTSIEKLRD